MTTALYLIGEPGVGKTTLAQHLYPGLTPQPATRLNGQLWGQPLTRGHITRGVLLGRPRNGFSGTDALGMSVNPDATQWAQQPHPYRLIIGEGARLTNHRFLTALHEHTTLTIAYLTATNTQERREARAQQLGTPLQSPQWVQGRQTATRNLAARLLGEGLTITTIDTTHADPVTLAQQLLDAIGAAK